MTKLCVLADTRSYHEWLRPPRAAITIHAGNFTGSGSIDEHVAFAEWFGKLPGMKVAVAGSLDTAARTRTAEVEAELAKRGIVLLSSARATVAGLRVWGGTAAPPRDESKIDVLVTHEAPYGVGDRQPFSTPTGSHAVLDAMYRIRPRVHVFCGTTYEAGRHDRPDTATVLLNAAIAPLACLLRRPLVHVLGALPVRPRDLPVEARR